MDTVTHALTGAVIGYCGFRQDPRGGRVALWTTIVAAKLPDLDVFMLASGYDTYLRWHRSFTHSALLWPVWAALLAGMFWVVARRTDYWLLFQAALAGIVSHLFLDWITSYGTMLLWPLTDARYELNWVFILDPYVWALLGVTLWATLRFHSRDAARWGLGIVASYILFCGATATIAKTSVSGGRVAAYAQPLNPLRHTIVQAEGNTIRWINGTHRDTFVQFQDDVLLPQAEATEVVKLYRWFAAFPLVERVEEQGAMVLRYRDLRFRSPLPWGGGVREGMFVIAKVYFDQQDHLLYATLARENR